MCQKNQEVFLESESLNNKSNKDIDFNVDNVKGIVENLIAEESGFFNYLIIDYLQKNKDSFVKKIKLPKEKQKIYNNEVVQISFDNLDLLKDKKFDDGLLKIALINIIKEAYNISDSRFHEVHYWKNENVFCIFNYKDEVKRFNGFSEDTMKSLFEKFHNEVDLKKVVEENIENYFDFNNYDEENIRAFYKGEYKRSIINIIQTEFYKGIPELLKNNMDNEVFVGTVQYFYRKFFQDLNNAWIQKVNDLISSRLNYDFNVGELDTHKTTNIITKKFLEFDSNSIIINSELNKKLSKNIFDNVIFPAIDYLNNTGNFNSENEKRSHEYENNHGYFLKAIYKDVFSEGFDILQDYGYEQLDLKLDKGLIKSILDLNLKNTGYGSLSFELSRLFFEQIALSYKDNNLKKNNGYITFFENFYCKRQNHAFLSTNVLKSGGIDPNGGFGVNVMKELRDLLDSESMGRYSKNLLKLTKNSKINYNYLHDQEKIVYSTTGFGFQRPKGKGIVSEASFVFYYMILNLSQVLIKKP